MTLDELAASQGPTLIKIDTQGFEREVLKGATRALSQAAGVFMELPIHQADRMADIEFDCLFRRKADGID